MRKLLCFDFVEEVGFQTQIVMWPFRPRGVLIWGAPPGASVEFFCGIDMQAIASFGHCPARFFATADSFAQVAKMVDDGKEPPAWVTWRACELGSVVRVHIVDANFGADGRAGRILGPKDGIELAMWGEASVLA